MKKFLKIIGLLVLAFVALILIGGLLTGKQYHFEKSIVINAKQEKVWENVSTLNAMTKWMPWMRMDPNMKSNIAGQDGNVGAIYTWSGDKEKVGEGSMTISNVQPMTKISQDLLFKGAFESRAKTDIILTPNADSTTKVTWTMDSEMPYPFNFISKLFMNMDEYMEKDYGAGLNNLKQMSEGK